MSATNRDPQLPAHLSLPHGARTPQRFQATLEAAQTRRAFGLLGLTALVPGSAQLVAGNRGVGKLALRIWGLVLAALVGLGLVALVNRKAIVSLGLTGWFLIAVSVVLTLLGVGWALLFLDAWRLGRPGRIRPAARIPHALLALVLAVAVAWAGIGAGNYLRSLGKATTVVLPGGGDTTVKEGRYNILLLGGDAGDDREGLRPDSINVVSVEVKTGRAVIVGIPRNIEGARFPKSSPLHDVFPDGYACPSHECMINAINTEVEANYRDLYPHSKRPGLEATKEAVEELTGLDINFFVLIDLNGFEKLIDAVGGVNVNLSKGVPIWWDATDTEVTYQIGPGKNIHLDGKNALLLVRARHGGTDFGRMQHQKCVMNAMLHQLNPQTVLQKFSELASASADTVATDIPSGVAGDLMEVAMKTKKLPIQSVSLVPPLVYPGSPNSSVARKAVRDEIEASKALDSGKQPTRTTAPTTTAPATSAAAPPATTAPVATGAPTSKAAPKSSQPAKTADTPTPSVTPSADPEAPPTVEDLAAVCEAA